MPEDTAAVPEAEIRELFAAPPLDDGDSELTPPCTIVLKSGKVFKVEQVDAWAHVPFGIFASGRWAHDYNAERDVVFPYTSIDYVDYDLDSLEAYLAQPEDPDGD